MKRWYRVRTRYIFCTLLFCYSVILLFRYSVIPLFRYSIIPLFRYSIILLFYYSIILLFMYSSIPYPPHQPLQPIPGAAEKGAYVGCFFGVMCVERFENKLIGGGIVLHGGTLPVAPA